LAGREVVPEFVQDQVRADVLGPLLLEYLDGGSHVPDWYAAFTAIHVELRRGASSAAAREVLELARTPR
jgi:lipid-A-disaccharide synthase